MLFELCQGTRMVKRQNKFFNDEANPNRVNAGSCRGNAGREFPKKVAAKLNNDMDYRKALCREIKREVGKFSRALAGRGVSKFVPGVMGGACKVPPKTSMRILWKDGTQTNFRMKQSKQSQIHLESAESFIQNFKRQFKIKRIPKDVEEAWMLFTGKHHDQANILNSISIRYVGEKIRGIEKKYNNRLTLASMHGYDPKMPGRLLAWICANISDLFVYCFSMGGAKDDCHKVDYLWYHSGDDDFSPKELYDLKDLHEKLKSMPLKSIKPEVVPGDKEKIGSTISLPFGKIQYHLESLQFRHDPEKIRSIYKFNKKKKFGSKAKISGHQNEKMIANELNTNMVFRRHFCERINRSAKDFVNAEAGGKNAKMECGVLGQETPGKADIVVHWKDGTSTGISIKMCDAGQVYLVKASNFIQVFEKQYKTTIPDNVKKALQLFVGEAIESKAILKKMSDEGCFDKKVFDLATHQNLRLMFKMIEKHDSVMANELLSWLRDQIDKVGELCFAAGAVDDKEVWADVLWYKNLVDVKLSGLDFLVRIDEITEALSKQKARDLVVVGPQNHGSTILLPFGHLQYHQKQLQFHQALKKIQALLE